MTPNDLRAEYLRIDEQGETVSVLQEWVTRLSMRQQTVLLSAIRGPDGIDKFDFVRLLVRLFRASVLKDAAPNNGFMEGCWPTRENLQQQFLKRPDAYPFHWLMHFMHAVEILGYEMPETDAAPWHQLYLDMADMMHLNPESAEQMRARLRDGGQRGCWKS